MNENEKVQRFLQIAKEEGLSYFAAIGIASNIKHESDWNEGLSEYGGTGFGLGQWTGETESESKQILINQGKAIGLSESEALSFDGQCRVMCRGDKTGQWSNVAYNYDSLVISPQTYPEFIALTNVLSASMNFMAHWERPSYDPTVNHKDRRKATALEYEKTYPNGDDWGSGGGSTGGSGLQLAVFPIHENCTVSQGENGEYSHMGTYAMDFTTGYQVVFPYYAPFDMKVVEILPEYTQIAWESNQKVRWVDGTEDFVSLWTIHDENYNRWKVGDTVKKNQEIGHSGEGGTAKGIHFHLESARGKYAGGFRNSQGVYEIKNKAHNYLIYSICNNNPKGEPITITGGNYPWQCNNTYQDGSGGNGGNNGNKKPKSNWLLLFANVY